MPDTDEEMYASDEDNEDETEVETSESSVIKGFRTRERQLKKQLKESQEQITSLLPFKEQAETAKLAGAFQEVGLTEKQAELFRASRPDVEVTPENIRTWATEFGFALPEGQEAPEPNDGFITPPSGAPVNDGRMTRDQWDNLNATNPAAAHQALRDGRYRTPTPEFQTPVGY